MIDVEWLRSLRFESSSGRITGLAGIGSQFIVFECVSDDGQRQVLKVPNTPHLGWTLREVPPDLSVTPLHDFDRLNAKLLHLVGNERLDGMAQCYEDLYAWTLQRLHRRGLDGLRADIGEDEDFAEAIAFLLHTPGMKRRLDDLAHLDFEGADPAEVVLSSGIGAVIEDTRGHLAAWARDIQGSIDDVPCPDWAPSRLTHNPLIIWGAAVMDGFFGREDLPRAAGFIETQYGRLSQREDALILGEQVFAMQTLAARTLPTEPARNFVRLCALAGFALVDRDGVELPVERIVPDAPAPANAAQPAPAPRPPRLPDPASAAPFRGEGRVDPYCRDPSFRDGAERRIGAFLGRLARHAHAVGLSVTIPDGPAGLGVVPWRSLTALEGTAYPPPSPLSGAAAGLRQTADLLHLLQRALVTMSAFDAVPPGVWDDAVGALESLGYLALGSTARIQDVPTWNAMYELGRIAARMHAMRFLHGDLHPGNFRFGNDGSLTSMFDLGRTAMLERTLTPLERAGDLAILKRHCDILGWEAAKAGYRDGAAEDSETVLALFPVDASESDL